MTNWINDEQTVDCRHPGSDEESYGPKIHPEGVALGESIKANVTGLNLSGKDPGCSKVDHRGDFPPIGWIHSPTTWVE